MVRFVPVLVVLVACHFDATVPPAPTETDGSQAVVDAAPDATPAALCMARYGTAASFDLCSAEQGSCKFYVDTNGGSCGDLCTNLGGSCVEAYDGDCGNISTTVRPCTFPLGDQVCHCRP